MQRDNYMYVRAEQHREARYQASGRSFMQVHGGKI